MAAATYTSDLTAQVISTCESNSTPLVFTNLGTGADATETDYFIQGSACVSKPFNITAGGIYCTTSQAITSGQCFWAWYYFGCPNALLAEASGGVQALIGQSGTAHDKWDVLGNDTYTYGGWRCIPVDFLGIGYDDRTGAGAGSSPFLVFGVYCNTSAGISKGNPLGIDVIRYGRGQARITAGAVASEATFAGLATFNDGTSARLGLFQTIDGGYLQQGLVMLGLATATTTFRARSGSNVATLTTASAHGLIVGDTVVITGVGGTGYNATAVVASIPTTTTFTYSNTGSSEGTTADTGGSIKGEVIFKDSNKNILIANTKKVSSSFNRWEIRQTNSIIDWTNIGIAALGTVAAGEFECIDNADINFDACIFSNMSTFIFQTASTLTNCIFNSCKLITSGGGVFTGTKVLTSSVAADAFAFGWNVATDPDGYLDNMTFSKGTNAHHAIGFGTSCPTTMTLRELIFSGFHADNGNNASALYFADKGTNTTWTINLVGCTGTITYKKARSGDTVNFVIDPSTFSVTVKNIDTGAVILGARVLAYVTSGVNFPYQASVTITSSGTTATVAHTAHGLASNDNILISGAVPDTYNGAFTITVTGVDAYTYTLPATATSPATGTITATMVLINSATGVSGILSDSRTYPTADQPVTGWVRKATYGPSFTSGTWDDTALTLTKAGAFTGLFTSFSITIISGTNMVAGEYLATYVSADVVTLVGTAGSANSSNVAFTIGSSALYKQQPISETINKTAGLGVTVQLIADS